MHTHNRGYTFIELMVTIAIIGTLSAIIAANIQGSRSEARDGQRITSLQQLKLTLETYYQNNGHYPNTGNQWVLDCSQSGNWIPDSGDYTWNATLMPDEPRDPVDTCLMPWDPSSANKSSASYGYISDGQYFSLAARLENPSVNDIQHTQAVWIDGSSLYNSDSWLGRTYVIVQQ